VKGTQKWLSVKIARSINPPRTGEVYRRWARLGEPVNDRVVGKEAVTGLAIECAEMVNVSDNVGR
jgi:hypothetical protein